MALDRGGLEYPINVEDQFSANLTKFRNDTQKATEDWKRLREELSKTASAQRALGRRRAGPSEAVRQAREERSIANERAKSERKVAENREKADRQASRSRQGRRRDLQEEERLNVRQAEIERRRLDEAEKARKSATAADRNRRAESERSERETQRRRVAAAASQARAARARQAAVEGQARVEKKAAEDRAKSLQRAEALEDRRAASSARRVAAEKRAGLQILSGQERLANQRATQQSRANAAAELATTRQESAQSRLLEQQLRGAERVSREGDRTSQQRETAARKARRDEEALRVVQDRRARAQVLGTTRQSEAEAASQARRLRETQQLEQTELRIAAARRRAAREQTRITKETKQAGTAAGQLLFTFRRLVGVLAIFTAARLLVQSLRAAVREAIDFNSRIQTAVLGIQSLLAATGELSTATGRMVQGAEAFAAANAEARRQVSLLRVEGLKTAATFTQLLEAFQTALAPGLRAGLSPDEVRGFAVRIAQAAAAIGLPQNQLAEEIRSILQGTIQARTTRIAVALGITNEDIRNAKEAGELADFLLERFSAFQFAGEASLSNFAVIIANLKDATSQLLGEGGREFFNQLADGLRNVLALLIQTTEKGTVVNPDALRIIRAFFSILTNVGEELGRIFDSFSLEGAADAATVIASVVNSIVDVAAGFAQGFVEVWTDVLDIIGDILKKAGELAEIIGFEDGEFTATFRDVAKFFGQLVAFGLVWRAIIFTIVKPISLIAFAFNSMAKAIKFAIPVMRILGGLFSLAALKVALITGIFIAIGAAIALVVAAFRNDFIRSIEIGGLKIGTIADTIKLLLSSAIKKAALLFSSAWGKSINFVKKLFVTVANFFLDKILAIVEFVLDIGAIFSDAAEDAAKGVAATRRELDSASEAFGKREDARLKKRLAGIKEERRANQIAFNERLAAIQQAEREGPRITPEEAAKQFAEGAKRFLGLSEAAADSQDEIASTVEDYAKAFAEIPPTVGATNIKLEQQAAILQRLQGSIEQNQESLRLAFSAQGLENAERRILRDRVRAAGELRKATTQIDARIRENEQSLGNIANKERKITEEILRQNTANRQQVSSLVAIGAELNDLQRRREGAATALLTLERQQRFAIRSNDAERTKATLRRLVAIDAETLKIDEQIVSQRALLKAEVERLGLSQEAGRKLLSNLTELVRLNGLRVSTEQDLTSATKERGRAEELINDALELRLRTILVLERERLRVNRLRAEQELVNARLVQGAAQKTAGVGGPLGGTAADAQREVAAAQVRFNLLIRQTQELARQNTLRKEALQDQLALTEDADLRAEIQSRINSLDEVFVANLRLAQLEAAEITKELARLEFILDQPLTAGLEAGFEDFVTKAGDSFAQIRNIGEASITGLADTIAQSLGDALDPSKKLDLVARFEEFFQQITAMVLRLIVNLLLVKALTEVLGLDTSAGDRAAAEAAASKAVVAAAVASAAAAVAQAAAAEAAANSALSSAGGFVKGGLIGGALPGASGAAFRHAQGLSEGGIPRPKGLHPSDRIPIWAGIGEFMQPVKSVQAYGVRVMEAIRKRQIDPGILKSLVGSGTASAARTSFATKGPGFQTGGGVSSTSGDSANQESQSLTIINVFDRQQLLQTLAETDGQEVLVNVMRSRHDDLRPAR